MLGCRKYCNKFACGIKHILCMIFVHNYRGLEVEVKFRIKSMYKCYEKVFKEAGKEELDCARTYLGLRRALRTLRHRDISAPRHFGTGTFRHRDTSAPVPRGGQTLRHDSGSSTTVHASTVGLLPSSYYKNQYWLHLDL